LVKLKKISVIFGTIFSLLTLLSPFGLATDAPTTHTPLVFNFISPQNHATYYTDEVQIIYSANSDIRCSYFVLDGPSKSTENWKRFEGNMTLTGLSEGPHNVTILVSMANHSDYPYYAKETVFFTVDLTNPAPSPSPTIPEYSLIIVPIILITTVFWIALRKKNLTVLP
jgi:hypothetical protein